MNPLSYLLFGLATLTGQGQSLRPLLEQFNTHTPTGIISQPNRRLFSSREIFDMHRPLKPSESRGNQGRFASTGYHRKA